MSNIYLVHENNPRTMPSFTLTSITNRTNRPAHFLEDPFSFQSNYDLSSHTFAKDVVFVTVDGLPKVELKLAVVLVLLVVSVT